MSRALNDLSTRFRPVAFEFLARLTEAQIPCLIVDTSRTIGEHEANLLKGTSWTKLSKHLDGAIYRNSPPGSDAMDVVPYLIFQLHGADKLQWDASDPVWQRIGPIGEQLGLRWGGRWQAKLDLSHFEFVVR